MDTDQFLISNLPDGGPAWHPQDSRFVAAEATWSTCMTQRGFTYATPLDAINKNHMTAASPESMAVAAADVQCKIDTNLVGIGVAVQSAYEQQYIDTHRDALTTQQKQIADFIAGHVTIPKQAPPTQQPSVAESATGNPPQPNDAQPNPAQPNQPQPDGPQS
ncbi:MAG: hypothetical protein LBV00_03445 [Propionibacteriaceae bacterium]|jgi:hypothetical protein|nr:hypothetical protein [Propionibacteriaceae bacterium]